MQFTYKGLKAELTKHIVTDEEVDKQLERVRQQNPRVAVVNDRPAQLGDEIVLDYAGFCDGDQFPGGTAMDQTLVLGSGMFIPGFEEQLVDKVPGEEVVVNVTFPEAYHAEELAGKAAQFNCTIKQIRLKTQYELDDTFAKEVGGCDTYDEMHQKMKDSLQAYADEQGEMDLQDQLLRMAAATLPMEISGKMLEDAMDEQVQLLEAQLAQQGLTIDMYCSFMNTTKDQIRQESKPVAESAIRCRAAVDAIVEQEGLQVEKEEIAEALAVVCRRNGMTMEQMKEHYDPRLEQAIINSVLTSKVMRLIRDAADIAVV